MTDTDLIHITKVHHHRYRKLVVELTVRGVVKRDPTKPGNPYFSKRMVEDERKRIDWRDHKKGQRGVNVREMSGPSSSSPSSSPSKKEEATDFSSNDEQPKPKPVDCEWCGWLADGIHKKCHVCFRRYKAGETDDNHRC